MGCGTEGLSSLLAVGHNLVSVDWHCCVAGKRTQGQFGNMVRQGEYSVYCRCQARRMGSSCSKDLNSPVAFGEGLLKATLGVRVVACMISLRTFF